MFAAIGFTYHLMQNTQAAAEYYHMVRDGAVWCGVVLGRCCCLLTAGARRRILYQHADASTARERVVCSVGCAVAVSSLRVCILIVFFVVL